MVTQQSPIIHHDTGAVEVYGSPFNVPVSSTVAQSFPLRRRTRNVMVLLGSVSNVTALSITGQGSGAVYANFTAAPPTGVIVVPISPAVETNIQVSVTCGAGGPCLVYVVEDSQHYGLTGVLSTLGAESVTLAGLDAPAQTLDGAGTPTTYFIKALVQLWTGSEWDRQRTPNVFKTAVATAAGNTAVWTPAAGKKFRLMGYQILVTENASLAVAGLEEITLNDSGTALGMGQSLYVPNAAATVLAGGFNSTAIQLGNGALSAAANNVLQVNLGTALATGECRVNAWGTEE